MRNVLFLFLILSATLVAQAAEQTTITTYYPSPYAVFNTLRIYPQNGASCVNSGEISFDSATQSLYVCNGTTWSLAPGALSSYPAGAIAMFADNCPAGWSNYALLNNAPHRFPRGTTGVTGGTAGGQSITYATSLGGDHTHTQTGTNPNLRGHSFTGAGDSCPMLYHPGISGMQTGLEDNGLPMGDHDHTVDINFGNDATMPSYVGVRFCQKN